LGERQVAKIVNEKILRLENDENSRLNGMLPTLSWADECEKKKKLVDASVSSFVEILKKFCRKDYTMQVIDGIEIPVSSTIVFVKLLMHRRIPRFLVIIDRAIDIERAELEILKKLADAERKLGGDPSILLSAAKEKAMGMKRLALFGGVNQLNDPNQLKTSEQRLNEIIANADRVRADVELLQKLHASPRLDLVKFLCGYTALKNEIIPSYKNSIGLTIYESDYYFSKFSKETGCSLPIVSLFHIPSEGPCLSHDTCRTAGFLLEQTQTVCDKLIDMFNVIGINGHIGIMMNLIDKYNLFPR
jgi:hypothetical protein